MTFISETGEETDLMNLFHPLRSFQSWHLVSSSLTNNVSVSRNVSSSLTNNVSVSLNETACECRYL